VCNSPFPGLFHPLNQPVQRVNLNDCAFLYAQSFIVPILLRYGFPGFLIVKNPDAQVSRVGISGVGIMNRKTVIRLTSFLLLIVTIICVVTGIMKWPGLISALGLTYRQVPVLLITEIHDWSGLLMTVLVMVHVYQFRGFIRRMARNLISSGVKQ
jgi:cytochrome b subunit of formate dehydrogenase